MFIENLLYIGREKLYNIRRILKNQSLAAKKAGQEAEKPAGKGSFYEFNNDFD